MLTCSAVASDQGIPDFWLNAMTNHDMVGEFITEADSGVLAYLKDVRSTSLTGDHAGSFKLSFYFRENPYFKNEVSIRPARGCVCNVWAIYCSSVLVELMS